MAILAFVLGVAVCQWQAGVPSWAVLAALAVAALAGLTATALVRGGALRPVLRVAACAALGFVWAASLAQVRLADRLDDALEGRDLVVVGVVASMPQQFERGTRFEFEVEQAQPGVPRRLWLAWYRGWREEELHRYRAVHAGERWRLTLRLRRPHGNANPQGFDYEAWLFERGLRATGYVRSRAQNQRLDAAVPRASLWVQRLREDIRDRMLAALPEGRYAGVLAALAVGDQRAIESDLWQVFNRSGTTHLMAISGLHVTMVGALVYALVAFAWRRLPRLALALATPRAAAVGGWAGAFAYCLVAGFGVPAQRTLYMLSVVALALLAGRESSSGRVLALALLVVLLLDPWAVLSAGFWLSFGAVAFLLYVGAGRLGRGGTLREWLRAQWAVTLGLIPGLLALFQQFSLVSPLANALAIPLVGLLVTPLVLAYALLPVTALLELAHALMAGLMSVLAWLAALPLAVWQQAAAPPWSVVAALAGGALLLAPRGLPGRWAGGFLFLPLLAYAPPRPPAGEFAATVLDVGQGLAVHVQTRAHDLVYDTGPQFSADADSGTRILLPYLRAAGVARLDAVVVSHQDNDHAGGTASLLAGVPVTWLMSSLPDEHPLRAAAAHRRCVAGQRWEWDGVRFSVLHPAPEAYAAAPARSNALSCVLRIATAQHSLLLAADIETDTEAELLRRDAALRASALVVPHHGSRSSSSAAFVSAVAPGLALFSVGYRSRFGHPHAEVLGRYESAGSRVLRTDRDGAVRLTSQRGELRVERQRESRRRYWQGG